MFLFLQNLLYKLRGERWIDTKLPNGIEFRLVFDRSDVAKAIIFRHQSIYKKSTFADIRGSLRIDLRGNKWGQLVEFSRSKGEAFQPPVDFHFNRERDRVFYSLDGTTFSIPCVSVEEVEDRLSTLC
jgi:hypothetical protein